MTNVRDTSAISEAENEFSGRNKTASDRIVELVEEAGPLTRRQIATILHMETATVSGRVTPLIKVGRLSEADQAPCPITHRLVYHLVAG